MLVWLLLSWCFLFVVAGAPGQSRLADASISLTKPVAEVVDLLAKTPMSAQVALIVDSDNLSPEATSQLLHAIANRCAAKGRTIAVARNTADGETVVTLACDSMVMVDGGTMRGCDPKWCDSPSRMRFFAACLGRTGLIDPYLAARVVSSSGALTWNEATGMAPDDSGPVTLADDGEGLAISTEAARTIGLIEKNAPNVGSLDDARKVVAARKVTKRSAPTTATAPGRPKPAVVLRPRPGTSGRAGSIAFAGDPAATLRDLRAAPTESALAIVMDDLKDPALDAVTTEELLHALSDRRDASGETIAVVSGAKGGASAIALACDAVVMVDGRRLRGCEKSWSTSQSRTDLVTSRIASLGKLDAAVAKRLVTTAGDLSCDTPASIGPIVKTNGSGAMQLATDGKTMELTAEQLAKLGVAVHERRSLADALGAIESGDIAATKARDRAAAADEPPAPRKDPRPQTKPDDSENAEASANRAKALRDAVADYNVAIQGMKVAVRKFNGYYEGSSGVWSPLGSGLKAVWRRTSGQTKDRKTTDAVRDLQQEIRGNITKSESAAKRIKRLAGPGDASLVERVKQQGIVLNELEAAIERNQPNEYEKWRDDALRLVALARHLPRDSGEGVPPTVIAAR